MEGLVETSDEWIRTRTGIASRKILTTDGGETMSSLSVGAAKKALEVSDRKDT